MRCGLGKSQGPSFQVIIHDLAMYSLKVRRHQFTAAALLQSQNRN